MKISVITVCFNAAATIEKTIQSVCSQVGADVEYMIVDGLSTDQTLAIINRYAQQISIIVSEKDSGIFDAMNKGIGLATGDVVYFLNADDYFADDTVLSDVSKAFADDASRSIVFGNVIIVGEPHGLNSGKAKAFTSYSITEFLHNSFCHQAVFAKRSLFTEIGNFSPAYKYSADYEWIIRAFVYNRRSFFFLDRNIAHYFYLGRSRLNAAVTHAETMRMRRNHLSSIEYAWYFFRYTFIRRIKKKLMMEPY
jgi:glycosyltransferase involved in cell wall biosynthesis